MPEILSQNEIDALLEKLTHQNNEPKKIFDKEPKYIKYDFKSPKRISKDQIKILTGIYENFSRHLSSYLSAVLRIYCEIKVESVEELPYFEYNNALPDTLITGIFGTKPLEEAILLDFSNNLTYSMLERLLGGNISNNIANGREFTEIDLSLAERILKKAAAFMEDAWSGFSELEIILQQIETNTRLIQTFPMEEAVIIISMTVTLSELSGTINCCIPCINFEPILDKLSNSHITAKREHGEQNEKAKEQIFSKINKSNIEICGVLGNTKLSLSEISSLQVGDVIKLEKRIADSIDIYVDNKKWFNGFPGIKHDKKAIKIDKVITERDFRSEGNSD